MTGALVSFDRRCVVVFDRAARARPAWRPRWSPLAQQAAAQSSSLTFATLHPDARPGRRPPKRRQLAAGDVHAAHAGAGRRVCGDLGASRLRLGLCGGEGPPGQGRGALRGGHSARGRPRRALGGYRPSRFGAFAFAAAAGALLLPLPLPLPLLLLLPPPPPPLPRAPAPHVAPAASRLTPPRPPCSPQIRVLFTQNM